MLRLSEDLGKVVSESTVQHSIRNVLGYSYKILEEIAAERYTPRNIW